MARPNLSYLKNLALTLTGIVVGIWSGLTGMGAALALAPLLVWLVAARGRALHSGGLWVTTVAAFVALLAYTQVRALPVSAAVVFTVGAAVGASIGASPALARARESRAIDPAAAMITVCIGAGLMYLAGSPDALVSKQWHFPHPIGPTLIWVAGAGVASALLGRIGNIGSLLSVPALLILTADSPRAAQATALFSLCLLSCIPAGFSVARHDAPTALIAWTGFGAALGALIGSRLAVELPAHRLVLIYGAGMALAGAARLVTGPPRKRTTAKAPAA